MTVIHQWPNEENTQENPNKYTINTYHVPTGLLKLQYTESVSIIYLHDSAAELTALHCSTICCHQMAFLPETQRKHSLYLTTVLSEIEREGI